MLLDTGADVSLLPVQSVKAMDIPLSSDKRLHLVGFDGTQHSYQIVEAQIVFTGKRFTGNYCVIDDALGILGRDILNQLTIVLDGPNLEWEATVHDDRDTST
jgi:predicted aspartyl protease